MRKSLITLIAVLALIVAADAQAHSAILVVHPKSHTLSAIAASQKENIKHNRYVCRHGGGWNQIRSCKALVWLKREYNETEAKLHPRVFATSHYDGWICIHNGEGAWNSNTGNGYLGGLQMTPGWGGASRPDLMSPGAQIALADGVAQRYGYADWWMRQQWPNTYPPCYNYFH